MKDWVSVSLAELSTQEPERKDRAHKFVTIHKKVPYPRFCRYCGHVPLSNWISKLVTKLGCAFEQDLRYKTWERTKKDPA